MIGCESQVVTDAEPQPTVVVERLTEVLPEGATLAGICLPRPLDVDASGRTSCTILEVSDEAACDCTRPGRVAPRERYTDEAIDLIERDPTTAGFGCVCELEQLRAPDLEQCQSGAATSAAGWCYVDSTVTPPLGDPALTARCSADEQRLVRFTQSATPDPGSVVFLACEAD